MSSRTYEHPGPCPKCTRMAEQSGCRWCDGYAMSSGFMNAVCYGCGYTWRVLDAVQMREMEEGPTDG